MRKYVKSNYWSCVHKSLTRLSSEGACNYRKRKFIWYLKKVVNVEKVVKIVCYQVMYSIQPFLNLDNIPHLAEFFRKSLGPKGSYKMFVTSAGQVRVSKLSSRIVASILTEIKDPCAEAILHLIKVIWNRRHFSISIWAGNGYQVSGTLFHVLCTKIQISFMRSVLELVRKFTRMNSICLPVC